MFCQEVVIWKKLSHPNVLPLLGVSKLSIPFYTISEWMENGNVTEYIDNHLETNRLQLVSDGCPDTLMHDGDIRFFSCWRLRRDWNIFMINL
jgi:serine/threonine protein kinase